MSEKPIIFSGPMVKAIFDNRKTQTRRLVTGRIALEWLEPEMFSPDYVANKGNGFSPYGYAGDHLWVRETFALVSDGEKEGVCYRVDGEDQIDRERGQRWRSPYFMPRVLSRLTLEVVNVKIERLQSICEDDLICEGIELVWGQLATDAFAMLWDSLNAKRGFGWGTNPWVWVVEFKKL